MAKHVCVFQNLEFCILTFLVLQSKANKCAKNESQRAKKAFCYSLNFLRILDLPINLNFVRAQFEFDIS